MKVTIRERGYQRRVWEYVTRVRDTDAAIARAVRAHFGEKARFEELCPSRIGLTTSTHTGTVHGALLEPDPLHVNVVVPL